MTIVTINREPSWGDMPVGAVVNLPPALADPLLASGEAVPTPNAVFTQPGPFAAGAVRVGGADYFVMSDGSLMPLAPMVGTGEQPRIAGVVTMQVVCDAGSDVDHAAIYWTVNCTTGDPDTADTALASQRFNAPNGDVYNLSLTGGAAGSILTIAPPSGVTMIHFAFAGSGTYTQAAGATVTALQMVLAKWSSSLNIASVVLYIGESSAGGGSNQRYRNIALMGFTAA